VGARALTALLIALVACKDKPAATPPVSTPQDARAHDAATTPTATTPTATKPTAAKPKDPVAYSQVEALVASWIAAQNTGAFDAYAALYADPFAGVRRTGKKTVRLDRAGWLADRKKMFARPMVVEADHVVIVPMVGRATVTFEQTWSSGKFRDVGPKVITVVEASGGLRIASEEMLASRIMPSQSGADLLSTLWLGYDGHVVLAGNVDMEILGTPVLLDGQLVERDPECDSDPPDYEQENGRYFDCRHSEPDIRWDDFAAEAPIKAGKLPAALAGIAGSELVGYTAAGAACKGTAGVVEAYGQRSTTQERITANGDSEVELARAVLEPGGVYLSELAPCKDFAFARPASAPTPVFWKLEELTELNAEPYLKELRAHESYGEWFDSIHGGWAEWVMQATSPDGKIRIIIAEINGVRSCEEGVGFLGLVWREVVASSPPGEPELELLYEDTTRRFDVLAVADLATDTRPELVLKDGFVLETPDDGYARAVTLDFPDEIADCVCDAEGFGCGAK